VLFNLSTVILLSWPKNVFCIMGNPLTTLEALKLAGANQISHKTIGDVFLDYKYTKIRC